MLRRMTSNPIIIKFFLGFHLNSEVRMYLNQSHAWKEEQLIHQHNVKETRYEDKDYIGLLLNSPLTTPLLKNEEQQLKSILQSYCPKLQMDKQKIYLFPQLFIS